MNDLIKTSSIWNSMRHCRLPVCNWQHIDSCIPLLLKVMLKVMCWWWIDCFGFAVAGTTSRVILDAFCEMKSNGDQYIIVFVNPISYLLGFSNLLPLLIIRYISRHLALEDEKFTIIMTSQRTNNYFRYRRSWHHNGNKGDYSLEGFWVYFAWIFCLLFHSYWPFI